MRSFEAVLIFVNLFVLILSFKKQSRVAWLRMAGINLAAFFLHGIVEGFRYQMTFSYLFVVLLVVFTLMKTKNKFLETKTPKGLKVIGQSLCLILLGFTSLLAYALPVFTLPKPTGNYEVGIQYFHLIDENRADPFLYASSKKRELMVKIYYPAKRDDAKPFSPYFHDSSELIKSFAAFYNLPNFAFDHLHLVRTDSKDDLQVSGEQQSYPIILFSHGAGTTMEVQTSQSEDLASHGYIVVAIDHTYVSAATVFPDRTVSHKEATTNFHTPEPAEAITEIMADDSKFVLDTLGKMNDGQTDSIFQGKLDLEKIGAIGHSVGGAVAYNLALNDPRVKAAIDLDGIVFVAPKDDVTEIAPVLMLANDQYHIQAIQRREPLMKKYEEMDEVEQKITVDIYDSEQTYRDAYDKAQQNVIGLTKVLKSSGNLFTIEGSDHMKFVDIGLFIGARPLRELIGIAGDTDPARCLEATKAITLTFFDQHLKGETKSLESMTETYPELQNVDLK
jgi:predicted dienelactone hydrolase